MSKRLPRVRKCDAEPLPDRGHFLRAAGYLGEAVMWLGHAADPHRELEEPHLSVWRRNYARNALEKMDQARALIEAGIAPRPRRLGRRRT